MANTINQNYSALFKSVGTAGKSQPTSTKNSAAEKNSFAQVGSADYSVELSGKGLNALQTSQVDNSADDISSLLVDESKLSGKAQNLLGKLREKYGDYNFIIANDVKDPTKFAANSERTYSVILSEEEIEKMAADEEFSDKIMENVQKATGELEELSEHSLGEGVNFSALAAEVNDQGTQKLFAGIEKMSADQQERFEKLKEKRAEEKKEAETKDAEKVDEEKPEAEKETFAVKTADVEAENSESLLEKIFAIDWDKISEQEFAI